MDNVRAITLRISNGLMGEDMEDAAQALAVIVAVCLESTGNASTKASMNEAIKIFGQAVEQAAAVLREKSQ